MREESFIPFALAHGLLMDMSRDEFPGSLYAWSDGTLQLADGGTHFGYVHTGEARLSTSAGTFTLKAGMYFSLPGEGRLAGAGQGIVVTRKSYRGLFSLGGPIEAMGRLRYIDGCTDSLLLPPVVLGDPCLNALYFPPGVRQTRHTHPSARVGLIVSGSGECVTPDGSVALSAGMAFLVPAGSLHSFNTATEPMVVIAYHPDSDFGPTHETHPMVNRTMVNGVSASLLVRAVREQEVSAAEG
jgi:hypothetical protein